MAALRNSRHERFAQELANGRSAVQAYEMAGFKADRRNAAKLHAQDDILRRVGELLDKREKMDATATERAVEKLAITKEWVIERLVENVSRAMQEVEVKKPDGTGTGEYKYEGSVANKALELLGKEIGMFIERKEVGKPGAFDDMTLDQKRERAIALTKQLGLSRFGTTAGSA